MSEYNRDGNFTALVVLDGGIKNPANRIDLRDFGAGLTRLELATSCVTGRQRRFIQIGFDDFEMFSKIF